MVTIGLYKTSYIILFYTDDTVNSIPYKMSTLILPPHVYFVFGVTFASISIVYCVTINKLLLVSLLLIFLLSLIIELSD